MKQPHFNRQMQSGMTLIELIVVLGIVAVVSAVLIFNYSGFRNAVTLRGLSQEIALAVRKAQTYATSVRSIEGASLSTTTFPGYGISFSLASATSANPESPSRMQFVLFADIPDSAGDVDGKYNKGVGCGDPTEGNECVESFSINTPDRIVSLCTDTLTTCTSTGTIDVVFDRPAPDAQMCVVSGGTCDSDRPSYVQVVVQAITGATRTITVWNTGQISVE